MQVQEAFNKFIKYQAAQNTAATVKAYSERINSFLHGYGDLEQIADLPDGIDHAGRRWLEQGHAGRPLVDVTPEQVDDWILILRSQHTRYVGNIRPNTDGGLSPATIEGRKQALRLFFGFCEERGYLVRSPARHVKKQRFSKRKAGSRVKKMRMYDLYQILDVATERADQGNSRDLAIVTLMAESGARPGEIASLNIADLNLDNLEAKVNGKTGERLVVFSEHTARCLADWIRFRELVLMAANGHGCPDALFIGLWPPNLGGRISAATLNSLFRRLGEDAGIEGVCSPYSVRHLVGDHLAMRAPVPLVQEVMGHEDISTTMIYVHPDMSKVKGVVSLHSPLNEYYVNG